MLRASVLGSKSIRTFLLPVLVLALIVVDNASIMNIGQNTYQIQKLSASSGNEQLTKQNKPELTKKLPAYSNSHEPLVKQSKPGKTKVLPATSGNEPSTTQSEPLEMREAEATGVIRPAEVEALPNLTPFRPDGWSDKIVVSTVTGTHSDSSSLRSTDTLYVDLAVLNNGGAATTTRFFTKLFIDGVERASWFADPPLNVNFYAFVENFSIGSLSTGTHTLKVVADALNNVGEIDELDNEYTKIINVISAGTPNLTPFQPDGWSDKIVVSTVIGTHSNNSSLRTTDTLYVDWAALNNGSGATTARFTTKLFVDGVERAAWATDPPLNVNFYAFVEDFSIGSLSAGTHSLKITTDALNNISESNELDNDYTKTITVSSTTLPNLTPFQPSGWSDKIVISTGTGTHSDSSSLRTTDTLYIDWAVLNNGITATAVRFLTKLFVDGVEKASWATDPPLNSDFYAFVEDFSIGNLSAGTHTLRIVADAMSNIGESNELDNEYTKTITISANISSTTISNVTLQSAKIAIIDGSSFGSSPRVLINDIDRSDFITSSSNTSITLKGKRKKMGLRTGDNTVRVIGTNGSLSNVYLVRIFGDGSVAPSAPDNLTATVVSANQINLTWRDNSNNEDGFKVERKTDSSGSYSEIASLSANIVSYQDKGLSPGTKYFYRIRAFISSGSSDYSNEASATTSGSTAGIKYSLYVNKSDPRLLRAETSNGDIVEYEGEKDAQGLATLVNFIRIKRAAGDSTTISVDKQGRPTQMRTSSGVILKLFWKTDTLVLLTAISPDGTTQKTFPINLANNSTLEDMSIIEMQNLQHEMSSQATAISPAATEPIIISTPCNNPDYSLITVKRCGKPSNEATVEMAMLKGGVTSYIEAVPTGVAGQYSVKLPKTDPTAGGKIKEKWDSLMKTSEKICNYAAPVVANSTVICLSLAIVPFVGEACAPILEAVKLTCAVIITAKALDYLTANVVDFVDQPSYQITPVIDGRTPIFDSGNWVLVSQNGPFPCFEVELPRISRLESFTVDPPYPVRGQPYTATAKVLCGSPLPNNPIVLSVEGKDGFKASVNCGVSGDDPCQLALPGGRTSTEDTFTVAISGFISFTLRTITITLAEPVSALTINRARLPSRAARR